MSEHLPPDESDTKPNLAVVEGGRTSLERQALEVLLTDESRFEVLAERLAGTHRATLRVIKSDSSAIPPETPTPAPAPE